MQRKFWKPSITSQFRICPVPFHFDTYRGCTYGCLFCFARDFIRFSRRNQDNKTQSYLVGNQPLRLKKWVNKTLNKQRDYNHAEQIAFKQRMPLKIGATADPFPFIQQRQHITYDCLKILQQIDYPVQISTKNPEIFLGYSDDFIGANISLNVSISFYQDQISEKIQCGAISPTRRFKAIKQLTNKGFPVIVRLQPFIYPYVYDKSQQFIQKISQSGCWGFQTEGLKLRVVMSQSQKEIYSKIGDVFGIDIINDFKTNGIIQGGDRVYSYQIKDKVLTRFTQLSQKYNLKFLNADNLISCKYGCGCECCGTQVLRDYKIWGGCLRSQIFKDQKTKYADDQFGKCIVNFTRSRANINKTIREVCQEYIKNRKDK